MIHKNPLSYNFVIDYRTKNGIKYLTDSEIIRNICIDDLKKNRRLKMLLTEKIDKLPKNYLVYADFKNQYNIRKNGQVVMTCPDIKSLETIIDNILFGEGENETRKN